MPEPTEPMTTLRESLRREWHRWLPIACSHLVLVVYLVWDEALGMGLLLFVIGMIAGQLVDDVAAGPPHRKEP